MRKLLVSVVASCAVIAIAPASALAHKHHRHHHRAHHARVHHRTFGSDSSQPAGSGQDQKAGSIQSFKNGVLTILLNDGTTTVSGMVTNATEIECQAADLPRMDGDGGDRADNNDQGDDNGRGDDNAQGDQNDQNDQNDQGDDNGQGDDEHAGQTCDSSNLMSGTDVREATLTVSSAGAVWNTVELVSSPSSTQSSGSDD